MHWTFTYLVDLVELNPVHILIEVLCLAIITYLICSPTRPYIQKNEKITAKEAESLISEFQPEPLVPKLTESQKKISKKFYSRILESRPYVNKSIVNGKTVLNLASYNFYDIVNNPEVIEKSEKTIQNYGVGSCGPRGFYGTIDVHLFLERHLAKFLCVDEAIIYADGISTLSSVISAFSKKDDLIICDKNVNYQIAQGLILSRSNVKYYKHNDMEDLERILEEQHSLDSKHKTKLTRRFIITEGVSLHSGIICPLPQLIKLKEKYRYRVILDDSLGLSLLAKKGSPEYHQIPFSQIDIYAASFEFCFGIVGGFCAGSHHIIDHQRLSSLAYVFSASSPPYECTTASVALDLIDEKKISTLHQNASFLRRELSGFESPSDKYRILMHGDEIIPIVYLKLIKNTDLESEFKISNGNETILDKVLNQGLSTISYDFEIQFYEDIITELFESHNIAIGASRAIPIQSFTPNISLMIYVSSVHSKAELSKAAKFIKKVLEKSLKSLQ